VQDDFVKRDCTASKANELWLTEIIEHPTKDGKLYLCAVKDVYSGRIERLLNGLTDEIPVGGERIGQRCAVTPANSHGGSNGAGISISFTALGSVPATSWTDWHDGPGGSTDNAAMK
jgi:transposase InsO family protein